MNWNSFLALHLGIGPHPFSEPIRLCCIACASRQQNQDLSERMPCVALLEVNGVDSYEALNHSKTSTVRDRGNSRNDRVVNHTQSSSGSGSKAQHCHHL